MNAKALFGLDDSGNLRTPGTVRKWPAGVHANDQPETTIAVRLSRSAEVAHTVQGTET